MKFSEYNDGSVLRITAYDQEQILINDREYGTSLIVTRTTVDTGWSPAIPGQINQKAIENLLAYDPEIILLGTGRNIVFPEPRILAMCSQAGAGLEVMDTASACRTFNVLLSEEREVIAGLLLPGAEDL